MKIHIVFTTCLFICISHSSASPNLADQIKNSVTSFRDFYEDLHQNPELSLKEVRTAQKVFDEMKKLGLEDVNLLGGGVVGVLKNGAGPTTLLRSELDALPLEEKTKVKFKSKTPGVMHACAHDLHTSATLAAVKVLIENRAQWGGTIVVVAQAAEEVVKGAKALIQAGLFKKYPKPNQCIAVHTRGHFPEGKVSYPFGAIYATSDSIDITFPGQGTHGASPHRGRDPIMLAAEYVLKTQTFLGREVDPFEPAVVTVGSIHGGTKHNIIPDEAKLQLTVRSYNESVRDLIIKRLEELAKSMAISAKTPAPKFEVVQSVSVNINDKKLSEVFTESTKTLFGHDMIIAAPSSMVAEDFGVLCKEVNAPGFVALIGAQMKTDPGVDNHSPFFLPDYDKVMTASVRAMVAGIFGLHKK